MAARSGCFPRADAAIPTDRCAGSNRGRYESLWNPERRSCQLPFAAAIVSGRTPGASHAYAARLKSSTIPSSESNSGRMKMSANVLVANLSAFPKLSPPDCRRVLFEEEVSTGSGSDRVISWQTIFSLGCDPVATAPGTDLITLTAIKTPTGL